MIALKYVNKQLVGKNWQGKRRKRKGSWEIQPNHSIESDCTLWWTESTACLTSSYFDGF